MGLNIQALAATAAKIGMSLAGSDSDGGAKIDITLHVANGPASYDDATDVTTKPVTDIDCEALSYTQQNQQTPGIQVTDKTFSPSTRKLLIESATLPDGTLITEEDTVTIAGVSFEILAVDFPPGKAIWILDIRH